MDHLPSLSCVPTSLATSIPSGISCTVILRGGDRIRIRPICAADQSMEKRFIEGLSADSRRFRFQESLVSPDDRLLKLLTIIDPRKDAAYIAVIDDLPGNQAIGVARFAGGGLGQDCEFSIVVDDKWQQKGVGTHLMRHLLKAAEAMGIHRIYSSDATDNHLMRNFARHLHLDHQPDPDDSRQVIYSTLVRKPGGK